MHVLCRIGLHAWEFESGGMYITLRYCQRCKLPDNELNHELISIERALWDDVHETTWTHLEQCAVVLRELRMYAGYSNSHIRRFYDDTFGYPFESWKLRPKPSQMAAEAAKRLRENHPLDPREDAA